MFEDVDIDAMCVASWLGEPGQLLLTESSAVYSLAYKRGFTAALALVAEKLKEFHVAVE